MRRGVCWGRDTRDLSGALADRAGRRVPGDGASDRAAVGGAPAADVAAHAYGDLAGNTGAGVVSARSGAARPGVTGPAGGAIEDGGPLAGLVVIGADAA